jgi:hypothetical protein
MDFASKPLDTIALPLLAPLAELVVRCEEHPYWFGRIEELPRFATACSLALSYPEADDPPVLAAVTLAGTLVALCADSLVDFVELDARVLGEQQDGDPATFADLKKWLVRDQPHPAEAALIAAAFAAREDSPLIATPGSRTRELARALFHYCRFHGATDWASALALARGYWHEPSRRESLLLLAWRSAVGAIMIAEGDLEEVIERQKEELVAVRRRSIAPRLELRQLSTQDDPVEANDELDALQDQLRDASSEIAQLTQQLRDAEARARSARKERDAARRELEPLRREVERQARHARAITLQHAELRASLDAGQAEEIEPPPEDGWPPDLLAGCGIQLFTGQERGGVRAQMADALRATGAAVEASDGNGREGVPDSFPEGTIVVCDVRFLSHTWSRRLADRARRSGVTYIEVRAGQGGIVRAVAAALGRAES